MTLRTNFNPDLVSVVGDLPRWCRPEQRRWGWRQLHAVARFSESFRARQVLQLSYAPDPRIAQLPAVLACTATHQFCGMVVIRDQDILFERYAADFSPDSTLSVQSITKTFLNLMVGAMWRDGVIALDAPISRYIPEIGSGYADATLQQVLNMEVDNDYQENLSDPGCAYFRHEAAMGWRIVPDQPEISQREFLIGIGRPRWPDVTPFAKYKCANTEVAAWALERASCKPLRRFLAEIADAAGLENTLHITTDRDGVPCLSGGACMTARDLARYFSLFARAGQGIDGARVGDGTFIDLSQRSGVPKRPPYTRDRYSNHLSVRDDFIFHSGWGGEFAMADLTTGVIGVYLSVLDNERAVDPTYSWTLATMVEEAVVVAGHSGRR
jgi:CubicO group peptidase (beta-lactamase class C family)